MSTGYLIGVGVGPGDPELSAKVGHRQRLPLPRGGGEAGRGSKHVWSA